MLVDQDDAPAIAREIGEIYKSTLEQESGFVDIWSEFERVRADEPIQMQYDGISGVMADSDTGKPYIIADNVQVDVNDAWTASLESAQAGFADWESALKKMAARQYISSPDNAIESMPLSDMNTDEFLTWLSITAGLIGLGAAGGGASSIVSSRRRFNQELGIK